jgi:23S rRNA (adenine2503-C2)-methyltransferase
MSNKISILDQQATQDFFKNNKIPPFRLKQIYKNIFTNSVIEFDDMTDLPLDLRGLLKMNFDIIPFELDQMYENDDSCKFGFKLADGKIIETVLMLHRHYRDSKDPSTKFLNRLTICISSQVGCPV